MSDTIIVTGTVATEPEMKLTDSGTARLTFRLASPQRKFDKNQNAWVDTGTNWYTVVAWRRLAENAYDSLGKGDRVIVSGRLSISDWERNGKSGTAIEITAETMGHDLFWGTATFRKPSSAPASAPTSSSDPWAIDGTPAPF